MNIVFSQQSQKCVHRNMKLLSRVNLLPSSNLVKRNGQMNQLIGCYNSFMLNLDQSFSIDKLVDTFMQLCECLISVYIIHFEFQSSKVFRSRSSNASNTAWRSSCPIVAPTQVLKTLLIKDSRRARSLQVLDASFNSEWHWNLSQ